MSFWVILKFQSTENMLNNSIKWSNMYKFIIKTFDQLKNDNFDQVKFDQVIIPHYKSFKVIFIFFSIAFLLPKGVHEVPPPTSVCCYDLKTGQYVKKDRGSFDLNSLDIFSWSKVSVKLGVWSKLFFFLVSWSNFTWSFWLIKTF